MSRPPGSSVSTLPALVGGLLWAALASSAAHGLPEGPRAFCSQYPEAPVCGGKLPTCAQCHTVPPTLNDYGTEVAINLWSDDAYDFTNYEARIPFALAAVEGGDADEDGSNNLEEILLGTDPANARSYYEPRPAPSGANRFYKVGQYDPRFAFKRVMILYCGRPPNHGELTGFPDDEAEGRARVQEQLASCLDSDYWRNEALHRLADKRIRPLESVGYDGIIPLADYSWDYRLFSYILSGDRDARDLLLADYHVDEGNQVVEGVIDAPPFAILETGGQPVPPEQRAGMITTQWFLMIHTMFSTLPRTTAAQAYRAYLGQDIAKNEGIDPVVGEPRDVDSKGVTQTTCAHCHSTLDPLSYAFSAYNGIGEPGDEFDFDKNGNYNPTRTPWGGDSVLLGEPVASLVDWAQQAADSDHFKRNLADIFWVHALGRPAGPDEQEAFREIWSSLPADGYQANKLIERIVLSDAFGVP